MTGDYPVYVKIMGALYPYDPDVYDVVAPPETTQEGIAKTLGIGRAHVAMNVNRFPEYFTKKLMHVMGKPRRVNAYFLTPKGRRVYRQITGQEIVTVYKTITRDTVLVLAVSAALAAAGLYILRPPTEQPDGNQDETSPLSMAR